MAKKEKTTVLRKLKTAALLRKGRFVKAEIRVVKIGSKEVRQYKTPGHSWIKTKPGMNFYT